MQKGQARFIQKKTEDLLRKLQIEAAVSLETQDDVYQINITGEDVGRLIGYHGETLKSFQLILSLMVYQEIGEWQNLSVDVGGWQKRREKQLLDLTKRAIQKAKEEKKDIQLPHLTPSERRFVHITVSKDQGVLSESEGEGNDRRVVIKLREKISSQP